MPSSDSFQGGVSYTSPLSTFSKRYLWRRGPSMDGSSLNPLRDADLWKGCEQMVFNTPFLVFFLPRSLSSLLSPLLP